MAGVMTIDDVYAALEDLRARRPLVQNITNYVAMTVSANVLLALGASPAMVHAAEEVEDFIAISDALAVNIGTLSPPWVDAMRLTVKRAIALGKPWVLDPVGCGATGLLAAALARRAGCVVAITGATDYVSDGTALVAVHSGHALMPLSTALGCSLSAVSAAFTAVRPPRQRRRGRTCRVRRCRSGCGATLPRARSFAGGNLRRAASHGPRDPRGPRAVVGVNEARAACKPISPSRS